MMQSFIKFTYFLGFCVILFSARGQTLEGTHYDFYNHNGFGLPRDMSNSPERLLEGIDMKTPPSAGDLVPEVVRWLEISDPLGAVNPDKKIVVIVYGEPFDSNGGELQAKGPRVVSFQEDPSFRSQVYFALMHPSLSKGISSPRSSVTELYKPLTEDQISALLSVINHSYGVSYNRGHVKEKTNVVYVRKVNLEKVFVVSPLSPYWACEVIYLSSDRPLVVASTDSY